MEKTIFRQSRIIILLAKSYNTIDMVKGTHLSMTRFTGVRSMIAICYRYRIKLYRINIIRDMVMQLNFTHLPKTGQYSKHMVASQTSWL